MIRFDAILDSILQKLLNDSNPLKRKSITQSSGRAKRPAHIQILTDKALCITMSRRNSSLPTPVSPNEAVYLFALEPAVLEKEYLECPALENPILKSKGSITIRQLQKHLRKHLWADQEINLEDVTFHV